MVLACDDYSWRYDYFPEYKHSRKVKKEKDESGINWSFVNSVKSELISELDANFPFEVIKIRGCEGDDVIGVLTKYLTTTKKVESPEQDIFDESTPEPILIISSDKDNFQLHTNKNVRQWSPLAKKLVFPEGDIKAGLIEKIICGEASDGIPNIISENDHYVNPPEKRVIMTAKKKAAFIELVESGKIKDSPEYEKFERNSILISYDRIPQEYEDLIISVYNEQIKKKHSKMALMNYLVKHKMTNILSNIQDFYL